MSSQTQIKRIKCPHCGWIRKIDISVIEDESIATVTRKIGDHLKATVEHIQALLAALQLDEANAWVDMPECPYCGNVYRYNVRTGEVAK
jgi:UDP-3-O-acyl-N-acetylglucosamine deacetylase